MTRLPLMPKLAVIVLVGSALLSNLDSLVRRATHFDPKRFGKDPITLQEKRFEPLKEFLPRAGRVGYVSNLKADDPLFDRGLGEYYSTQYALAPVVVVNSASELLIVGNFLSRHPVSAPTLSGTLVIKDLGNGVSLYSRGPH